MKIKLSTDSTGDIPFDLRDELGISVLPITIIMEDQTEYQDSYDIVPDKFYPMLNACDKLPVSSQVTPFMYTELYERVWQEGYDALIHTAINSGGSASWQSAVHMRDVFYENHPEAKGKFDIRIIDSKNYSMGYGLAVIQAAQMVKDGKGVQEIVDFIQDWVDHVHVVFVPFNLRFVKKSGRVSAAAAFIGDAVGLKPVITFENGASKIITKVRGAKKVLSTVVDMVASEIKEGTPYAFATGCNPEQNDLFRAAFTQRLGTPDYEYQLGCVITINSGPDAIGIIYRV